MQKPAAALLIVLVVLIVPPAAADESPAIPLKAEMTALFTGGIRNLYLSADPSVVWKPRVFGAGIGIEIISGMSQFDLYLHPYLRTEAGIAHLGIGYVIPVIRPPDDDELTGANVGIAVTPKPFTLGYGLFGFEIALDFGLAAARAAYDNTATLDPSTRILLSAIASVRLGLGVTYSFEL